jgi:hypothetical protein
MRQHGCRLAWSLHAAGLAAVGLVSFHLAIPGEAVPSDLVLFDAPRGSWLGTIRSDAAPVVLEERDGWRRVRVEGWIPGTGTGDAASPPEGGPAPAAGAVSGGAVIRGVLPSDGGADPAGAGMIVFLVSEPEALDREHGKAGEECRGQVNDRRERVIALRGELDRALNSSSNFRVAAQRNDRLKAQVEAAERDLRERLGACRRRAVAMVLERAVRRTAPDGSGRFEFNGVAPGRYRVIAVDPGGAAPVSWSFECSVAGSETKEIDPRSDRSPVDLYWDLHVTGGAGQAPRS